VGRGWRAVACVALVVAACNRFPDDWLYVTRVGTTGAVVVWTSAAAGVRCTSRGGGPVEAAGVAGRRGLRVARLAGLAPATAYRCDVGRRVVRFRTAPANDAPFVFAAVGDSGDGSAVAARLARRIRAGRPAFLVHLGDFAYTHGTASEYARRFFRPYARTLARVPLMPTPGNHDLHARSAYRDLFAPVADGDDAGGPHYAFDWGAAHFDSVASPAFARGAPAGVAWLASDLAAAAARPWRVVFLHEPLWTAGAKATVPGLRAVLAPVLDAGRVDLVLAGHQHFYERARPACLTRPDARVVEIISGGGGANLDPAVAHPDFPRTVSATHYVRVRVAADALDLRAIDVDGRVLDHVRRRRGDAGPCLAGGWPAPRDR